MRTIYNLGILSICLLTTTQLNAATDLSSLSAADQDAISRLCSPVQYREGAEAYRRCVQSEVQSIEQDGESPLSNLSFDDKYAAQQFCATAGADHRRCISDQVNAVRNFPAPNMQNITEDERYAIQQSCFSAQTNQGLLAYRQCVGNEVASLAQLPRVKLDSLPILERNALKLRCSANSQSAAAYRQCLSIEYSSFADTAPTFQALPTAQTTPTAKPVVRETPRVQETTRVVDAVTNDPVKPIVEPLPTTSAKPASDATQLVAQNTNTLPVSSPLPRNIDPQRANNPLVVNKQFETTTATDTIAANDNNPVITEEVATDTIAPVNNPRVISKPALAEKVQRLETEPRNGLQNEAQPMSGILKTFQDGFVAAGEKLAALTTLGKIVLATVLAIPLLFLFIRRSILKQPQQASPTWEQNQHRYAEPGATYSERKSTAAIKARWDDDFLAQENIQRTEQPELTEQPLSLEDLPTRRVAPQESYDSRSDETATRFVARQTAGKVDAPLTSRWQSGFGSWLESEPVELRQRYCTEFLIYWMAYGDERYEKGLKREVFTAREPDQHMLIKRWVLKQDAYAFADAIHWVRNNANRMQREQLLDLLMALLVTENNITPNQNILLRMLADAFGIGSDALKERFLFTFSEDLPAFPRPDNQNWWLEQTSDCNAKWDARKLAALPKAEQMMSRLGLSENYTEAEVVSAFRRAAKRCHPDRYSQLGAWEQSLAQRQYMKFEEARDWLLGVSA